MIEGFKLFIGTFAQSFDWSFPYVFFILLAIFILIAALYLLYIFLSNKKINNHLKKTFSSKHVNIINFNTQKVKIINLINLDEIREINYVDFLKYFFDKEESKVNNWLKGCLTIPYNKDSENNILISDLSYKSRNGKDTYIVKVILFCTKIDKTKNLVYIESTLLKYLPSEYLKNRKGEFHKFIYSSSDMNRLYSRGTFIKGNIFGINFLKKKNTNSQINEYLLRYLLLNSFYKRQGNFLSYYCLSEDKSLSFYILDTKYLSDYKLNKVVKDLIKVINEILEVKGCSEYYDFIVSASHVSDLGNDYLKACESINKLTALAKDSNKQFLIYKKENGNPEHLEDSYKDEITKILNHSLINIDFSGVFKVSNKRVICAGYIVSVSPKQSLFDNINEVKVNAKKYNLGKDIYSLLARKIIPTFNSQKEQVNYKLYYPILLDEVSFILKSFSRINEIDSVKLVFVINNNDLIDFENNEKVMDSLKALQEKGYELYLRVNVGDYVLKNVTYNLFDGFMVDAKLENNAKPESREYLKACGVFDKLIKYKEPIISIHTNSWQEIELLLKTGIVAFSSNVISERSPMLLPINKKVSKKLLNMYKK